MNCWTLVKFGGADYTWVDVESASVTLTEAKTVQAGQSSLREAVIARGPAGLPEVSRWRVPGGAVWWDRSVSASLSIGDDVTSARDLLAAARLPVQVLKDDLNRVTLVDWHELRWVVKRQSARPWKRWFYHWFRRSSCWREWQGAHCAARGVVRVNRPLMLLHEHRFGRWEQTIVYPYVAGEQALSWFRRHQLSADHARVPRLRMAKVLGEQIGALAAVGAMNRDYRLANLIVDRQCLDHGEQPVLIDCAGIFPTFPKRAAERMLRVLYRTTVETDAITRRELVTALGAAVSQMGERCRLTERQWLARLSRYFPSGSEG